MWFNPFEQAKFSSFQARKRGGQPLIIICFFLEHFKFKMSLFSGKDWNDNSNFSLSWTKNSIKFMQRSMPGHQHEHICFNKSVHFSLKKLSQCCVIKSRECRLSNLIIIKAYFYHYNSVIYIQAAFLPLMVPYSMRLHLSILLFWENEYCPI